MKKSISIFVITFLAFLIGSENLFAQASSLRNVEALILKDAYSQAARECKRILADSHQSAVKSKAYYLLGMCLLKNADYAGARENFQMLVRKYPRSNFCDDAKMGIADSYFLAGDFQQAQQKYTQFLQDFPRSELTDIARKHQQLCKQEKHLSDSYFSIQLGCFAEKNNAEKLRDELIDKGYQAYIIEGSQDNLSHVRVGKFDTRLKAEFLEQQLKAAGFSTKVCP